MFTPAKATWSGASGFAEEPSQAAPVPITPTGTEPNFLPELAAIPIPSAIWLLGSAFIGLVGFRKKFKK